MSDRSRLEELLADPRFHLEGREPDEELRESMRAHGWLPHLPALRLRDGTLLVGHRRMTVADELGIDPVVEYVDGQDDPTLTVRLALMSNEGGAPWTRKQRQQITSILRGDEGWSQQRIAEALGVSQKTVSNDLRTLETTSNVERRDTLGRKAAPGRPRKEDRKRDRRGSPAEPKQPRGAGAAELMAVWQAGQNESERSTTSAAIADLRSAAAVLQPLIRQHALTSDEFDQSDVIVRELSVELERVRESAGAAVPESEEDR